MAKVSVLFVCLGNICRSPTAHIVFQSMVEADGLSEQIAIDSCGTGDWHIGRAPDARSQHYALDRGYDMSGLRARLLCADDFDQYDYILAMDKQNLADIQALKPNHFNGEIALFLNYCRNTDYLHYAEVPDPYYGGVDGFTLVLDLIEDASKELLKQIVDRL